jgi:peptidoglycan hydrolase CwlO-like protein
MIGERESGSLDPLTAGKPLERVLQHADSLATEDDPQRELLVRIAELEEDVADLQRVCDERQKVIEELRQAADERLRLVEALDRAAAERLALVERLDGELKALRNKSRA